MLYGSFQALGSALGVFLIHAKAKVGKSTSYSVVIWRTTFHETGPKTHFFLRDVDPFVVDVDPFVVDVDPFVVDVNPFGVDVDRFVVDVNPFVVDRVDVNSGLS